MGSSRLYSKWISTHAPAGGATWSLPPYQRIGYCNFYSRPCGRGDGGERRMTHLHMNFYSRPCGRGDAFRCSLTRSRTTFLLTPLREGRPWPRQSRRCSRRISTHAPAGGATLGRVPPKGQHRNFYSRPCGRGDSNFPQVRHEVLRQIAER